MRLAPRHLLCKAANRLSLRRASPQDLDVDMRLALGRGERRALVEQIRADAALLAGQGVMDYSLLLGVHYPRWGDDAWRPPRPPQVRVGARL